MSTRSYLGLYISCTTALRNQNTTSVLFTLGTLKMEAFEKGLAKTKINYSCVFYEVIFDCPIMCSGRNRSWRVAIIETQM